MRKYKYFCCRAMNTRLCSSAWRANRSQSEPKAHHHVLKLSLKSFCKLTHRPCQLTDFLQQRRCPSVSVRLSTQVSLCTHTHTQTHTHTHSLLLLCPVLETKDKPRISYSELFLVYPTDIAGVTRRVIPRITRDLRLPKCCCFLFQG